MLKDSTYKEKFTMLKTWMPLIIETTKKDLKNDHLKRDPGFARLYLPGKNAAKLTTDEMAEAYSKAIESDSGEELAEFIANRWMLKHSDIYEYFEQELSKINPNFSEIQDIDKPTATKIMEGAVHQFGSIATYLFCVFNSVVFPEDVYKQLGSHASKTVVDKKEEDQKNAEDASLEALKRNHEQQMARMVDKYEKKLLGLQKKYILDVETLKKQIANLQRKLTV